MNLIEFDKENYSVKYSPQLLTLKPFKKLIDRDKSKGKEKAVKEISFIAFFTDLRSDYMYIINAKERERELIKDLELGAGWKVDTVVQEAIDFYKERSRTINSSMYEGAQIAANAVNDVCKNAKDHITSSEDPLAAAQKVTAILEKIPKAMANLNSAYTELIKEQKILEGRSKGSREFNMFEEGLEYENE